MNDAIFVYVISVGDAGPTKIGIARNIPKRFSNIQSCNPYRLVLSAQFLAPSKETALEIEQITLGQFRLKGKRLLGEWLDVGPAEVTSMVLYVIKECGNGAKQVSSHTPRVRCLRVVTA